MFPNEDEYMFKSPKLDQVSYHMHKVEDDQIPFDRLGIFYDYRC